MKKGFTLAETLITLVIIGVIAAITVPNLIIKHQKEQTVTRLKKTYSSLNQSLVKNQLKYGSYESWDDMFKSSRHTSAELYDLIDKYFVPTMVTMENTKNFEECWQGTKTIDGITSYLSGELSACFRTADGTSIGLFTACGNGLCVPIFAIDTNGPKKPNRLGRDVFMFTFERGIKALLQPYCNLPGSNRDTFLTGNANNCSPATYCRKGTNATLAGAGCTAVIMMDGWQIKDDYPW